MHSLLRYFCWLKPCMRMMCVIEEFSSFLVFVTSQMIFLCDLDALSTLKERKEPLTHRCCLVCCVVFYSTVNRESSDFDVTTHSQHHSVCVSLCVVVCRCVIFDTHRHAERIRGSEKLAERTSQVATENDSLMMIEKREDTQKEG